MASVNELQSSTEAAVATVISRNQSIQTDFDELVETFPLSSAESQLSEIQQPDARESQLVANEPKYDSDDEQATDATSEQMSSDQQPSSPKDVEAEQIAQMSELKDQIEERKKLNQQLMRREASMKQQIALLEQEREKRSNEAVAIAARLTEIQQPETTAPPSPELNDQRQPPTSEPTQTDDEEAAAATCQQVSLDQQPSRAKRLQTEQRAALEDELEVQQEVYKQLTTRGGDMKQQIQQLEQEIGKSSIEAGATAAKVRELLEIQQPEATEPMEPVLLLSSQQDEPATALLSPSSPLPPEQENEPEYKSEYFESSSSSSSSITLFPQAEFPASVSQIS